MKVISNERLVTPEPANFVILLAEDEPADAHLVQAALAEGQVAAQLYHVSDGQEVLDFLQRQGERFANAPRPDLILLDLNMPRMDGRECLAALKNDAALRSIPAVILTTSEVERDMLCAYDLGADGYVTKALDLAPFTAAICQLCADWIKRLRLPHPQA